MPSEYKKCIQADIFSQLQTEVRNEKYITTGAYIPNQRFKENDGKITIKVKEGSVEDINIRGDDRLRLDEDYVESRLHLRTKPPLNQEKLLEALRILQINPLIKEISAELKASTTPGKTILEVEIKEEDPFSAKFSSNNGRSPSVGSFRRGARLTHDNLLGIGDSLSVSYSNTDGSNNFNTLYSLPFNSRDGELQFNYGTESSTVIESEFDELDIETDSRYYQLTLRQPIDRTFKRSFSQEFALGLTFSRNESESTLLGRPTPLSAGADAEGKTRISAIRFSQEWIRQNRKQIFEARSQFNFGIDALNATISDFRPDGRFFSWRGQFQWARLFGTTTKEPFVVPTLLIQTAVQFADQPLVSVEQFGIGGLNSVRGYRQDALLADNGVLATAEIRLPVLRISDWKTAIVLISFVNVGSGWNSGATVDPDPATLASVGFGIQLLQSNNFSARLDWGIPLVEIDSRGRSLQEDGIYFSIELNPF